MRDVALGREQATRAPSSHLTRQIVSFELGLYTTQVNDTAAGNLAAGGVLGAPQKLYLQPFYIGINNSLGHKPGRAPLIIPSAFTVYSAWSHAGGHSGSRKQQAARAAIARGEAIFNTRKFAIAGVAGLNDALNTATVMGTCASCHDTPNVGNHSVTMLFNIGIADYPARPGLDISGLPAYRLYCPATGAYTLTTDPGRALITGSCQDIGKFKVPVLRGLAARAPYFHNGSAATLGAVVAFYNKRFNIGFSARDTADLVAFLRAL